MKLYRIKDKSNGKYHGGGADPFFREVSDGPIFYGKLYNSKVQMKVLIDSWKKEYEENPDSRYFTGVSNLIMEECKLVIVKEESID